MLRSDGTLALGVAVAVPPPPHAVTKRPAANRAGAKRASFMRTYLSDCNFPLPSSRARGRGESAPADRAYSGVGLFSLSGGEAAGQEHCSHPWVCQETVTVARIICLRS